MTKNDGRLRENTANGWRSARLRFLSLNAKFLADAAEDWTNPAAFRPFRP